MPDVDNSPLRIVNENYQMEEELKICSEEMILLEPDQIEHRNDDDDNHRNFIIQKVNQ